MTFTVCWSGWSTCISTRRLPWCIKFKCGPSHALGSNRKQTGCILFQTPLVFFRCLRPETSYRFQQTYYSNCSHSYHHQNEPGEVSPGLVARLLRMQDSSSCSLRGMGSWSSLYCMRRCRTWRVAVVLPGSNGTKRPASSLISISIVVNYLLKTGVHWTLSKLCHHLCLLLVQFSTEARCYLRRHVIPRRWCRRRASNTQAPYLPRSSLHELSWNSKKGSWIRYSVSCVRPIFEWYHCSSVSWYPQCAVDCLDQLIGSVVITGFDLTILMHTLRKNETSSSLTLYQLCWYWISTNPHSRWPGRLMHCGKSIT